MSRIILLACTALIAMTLGCSRKIDSLDPVRTIPDPLEAPVNVALLIGSGAVTITWEMPDPAEVAFYRVYVADSTDETFSVRDTSYSLSRTITGLLFNREYTFEVAAVRAGGAEGRRSSPVSVRVPALSLVINGDEEFTKSVDVGVLLNAGLGATEYQLSEDINFASAPILNFSSQVQFRLSTGDAKKRVYARYYYVDGSRTNAVMYDEITLDTKAYVSSFTFTPTTPAQTGDVITFYLTSGETKGTASVSFIGAPLINLLDDGGYPDLVANDGTYSGRWFVPVGFSASGEEVTGKFADAAGNEALQATAPTLLTVKPTPTPVSIVSTVAISTFQIELNWTQATTPIFRNYRVYRDANANVTAASTLVTTINAIASSGYRDTSLNANTMYYYRVYVADSFGVSIGSNVDSARTQVNTAPNPVVLAGSLSSDSATFELSWTRSAEIDFASYRLYRKNSPGVTTSDQLVDIINSASTDNATDFVSSPPTVYYRIFVFDRHGLSAGSNEIQLTK